MNKINIFVLLITVFLFHISSIHLFAQNWEWESKSPMPEAISNNAVTAATVNGVPHVFSFTGIDTSKIYSGISNKAFRYNTETAIWDTIPPVPIDIPVIAAGASTVNNKIYIIGGYTVLSNGNEISSNQVFIYNPESNTYTEGAELPVPIDDHIQAVWRDSLIYVVTGWSNTTNVSDVQIYDPANDTWTIGTATPNTNHFKVFGGSGTIIGDTLYYAGGAGISAFSFVLQNFFRKAVINPANPSELVWLEESNDLSLGYRMASATFWGKAVWFGGSAVAYNYNGIAYNGTGGVPPLDRIVSYDPNTGSLSEETGGMPFLMDLRGIAQVSENSFMLVGGMREDQTVSNETYLIRSTEIMTSTPMEELEKSVSIHFQYNHSIIYFEIPQTMENANYNWQIIDTQGRQSLDGTGQEFNEINVSHLPIGTYILTVQLEKGKKEVFQFIR